MRKFVLILLILLLAATAWAQAPASANDDQAQMRQEIDQLKKALSALEQRLAAQEKAAQPQNPATQPGETVSVQDLKDNVKDLNERVNETERKAVLDRVQWSGDYRFQAHTIRATIPGHYDGMQLQSLMTKAMWMAAPSSMGGLGGQNGLSAQQMMGMLGQMSPSQFYQTLYGVDPTTGAPTAQAGLLQTFNGQYQYFSNNITYNQLNGMVSQFTPQQVGQFMQYLMSIPGPAGQSLIYTPGYSANNDVLFTNRLRLRFDAKVADNITFTGRLSMYKAFGDSTMAQVFNGQPNSFAIDGTTARVPTGDMLRVERALFSWNNIGGSKFYFSIGRRPSTDGPPMNFREDEPRGGTPPGDLFNYQYDGMTFGYHITDKTTARICYGMGYQSGFGNGSILQQPADRVKDVHLMGGMVDIIDTDKTFIQAIVARAWNVTDGFAGMMVLRNNPLTGDAIAAPVILRYSPSANLGAINLYGLLVQKTIGPVDLFVAGNMDSLRPNGITTPFGGLGSDPYQKPTDHNGTMVYAGLRYSVPKDDGRTKIGFEFNHGSKYWFNFAQAEDDLFMPKTSTRGEAYETYLTHRINDHFIFKADYQHFNFRWSGSGWHVMQPKPLDTGVPQVLGFPAYDNANMFTIGLTARF